MFSSVSGIHHRGGDPYEIGSDTSIPNFIFSSPLSQAPEHFRRAASLLVKVLYQTLADFSIGIIGSFRHGFRNFHAPPGFPKHFKTP